MVYRMAITKDAENVVTIKVIGIGGAGNNVVNRMAAGDLTQDELALIAEYVKRDLGNYDESRAEVPESAFMLALKDTVWSWLADVTDRAQVEWSERAVELEHKGVYRAGDWVGLGVLVCDHCEWRHTVLHPQQLGTCPECGANEYHREPLSP